MILCHTAVGYKEKLVGAYRPGRYAARAPSPAVGPADGGVGGVNWGAVSGHRSARSPRGRSNTLLLVYIEQPDGML